MDTITFPIDLLRKNVNNLFANKQPFQIVCYCTCTILLTVWIRGVLYDEDTPSRKFRKSFFKWLRYIPYVRNRIESEMNEIRKEFQDANHEKTKHLTYIAELPKTSQTKEEILSQLSEYMALGDYDWQGGSVSGSVYYNHPDLINLVKEVYGVSYYTNPLHMDVFPGLCKMEAEIIAMVVRLFHGDTNCKGTLTTGGTESIIMAAKAYRDYGREVRGIKNPEIIVGTTAHSAFDKAAQYLKLRVRTVPCDPITCQVDVAAMRRAINSNTIMLVGSAPNFPYGTLDDIEAISNLGVRYGIPVHVDSCLGGFLTIFMQAAGYPPPTTDFRLPGVTSISADTHKYGFAPKGTSLILYRDVKYLHHQYTVTTDWPGGVYGSPTVCGSRAGGAIAACWATLLHFGIEGYVETTREIVHTTKYIEKGLRRIENIYIFGQPATSVIAVGSKVFDIFRLQSDLRELGWHLNPLQFPSAFHLCVTHVHTKPGVADRFLKDVKTCIEKIMVNPSKPVEGQMAVYGVAQTLPDRSLVADITKMHLDNAYYMPAKSD